VTEIRLGQQQPGMTTRLGYAPFAQMWTNEDIIEFVPNRNWTHCDVDDYQILYDVLEHEICHIVLDKLALLSIRTRSASNFQDRILNQRLRRMTYAHLFQALAGWK
jgi:hypothetical protein